MGGIICMYKDIYWLWVVHLYYIQADPTQSALELDIITGDITMISGSTLLLFADITFSLMISPLEINEEFPPMM